MPKKADAPATGEDAKKSCFVISPIGSENTDTRKKSNNVLEFLIRRPLDPLQYDVKRADDIKQPGSITVQVIDRIINADLVVADLSGGNPNVFYELAIRDAYRKPSVLIYDNDDEGKIPFDVSQMRAVAYSHSDQGLWEEAKDKIVEHVRSIERGDTTPTILQQVEMIQHAEEGAGVDKMFGQIMRTLSSIQGDTNVAAKYANHRFVEAKDHAAFLRRRAFLGGTSPLSTGINLGTEALFDPIAPESFEKPDWAPPDERKDSDSE